LSGVHQQRSQHGALLGRPQLQLAAPRSQL
jgi:hypothetical protein